MPFDLSHPSCILKILLYASTEPHEPFSVFSEVAPEWYDTVEPHGASAILQNLNCKRLPTAFLRRSTSLAEKSFDARPFFSIDYIPVGFMSSSPTLVHIDFSNSFPNVTEISDSFLLFCSALKTIDLTGMKKVQAIGDRFCDNCLALEKIEFNFPECRRIGLKFLGGTINLRQVDVSSFDSLEWMPDWFCYGSGIEKIIGVDTTFKERKFDLIAGSFLASCSNLKEIDVSFFQYATRIGGSFLQGCMNLETIHGLTPNNCQRIEWIDESFLRECRSLKNGFPNDGARTLEELFPAAQDVCNFFMRNTPLVDEEVGREFAKSKAPQRKNRT